MFSGHLIKDDQFLTCSRRRRLRLFMSGSFLPLRVSLWPAAFTGTQIQGDMYGMITPGEELGTHLIFQIVDI